MQEGSYANITEATVFGLGSGIGWFLAIVGIAAIREKIRYSPSSSSFKRLGYYFYHYGFDGNSFYEFYRN